MTVKVSVVIKNRITINRGAIFFIGAAPIFIEGIMDCYFFGFSSGVIKLMVSISLVLIGMFRLKRVSIFEEEIKIRGVFDKVKKTNLNWNDINKYKILNSSITTPNELILWFENGRVRINLYKNEPQELRRVFKKWEIPNEKRRVIF